MIENFAACKLSQIITELESCGELLEFAIEDGSVVFSGITTRSDQIASDVVFLAYSGVRHDAHDQISSVISRGCPMIIVEQHYQGEVPKNMVRVRNGRRAWAFLAALLNGHPEKYLDFLGVTGTNGKTSTVWYAYHLLKQCGQRVASFGTLGHFADGIHYPGTHTTPDPPELFFRLRKLVENGIKVVVMEVSSQAVMHNRVAPIRFSGGAFTSFSQDHLDAHGTMDAYFRCKWKFTNLMVDGRVFLHESGRSLFGKDLPLPKCVSFYSSVEPVNRDESKYDFHAVTSNGSPTASGQLLNCRLVEPFFRDASGFAPTPVRFLQENFLAALLLASTWDEKSLAPRNWRDVNPVPGRFQLIHPVRPMAPRAVVDYAHSPDGLEKLLFAARAICSGELVVIFGCGGNRDATKRPIMGEIAARLADHVILTSDNPRDEDPEAIIDQICTGIFASTKLTRIVDRREAISVAYKESAADTLIVIAGKGHETYQEIAGVKLPFDDSLVAIECSK